MPFVAVVETTQDGRVAKFAEFPRQIGADAHAAEFGGFVVHRPNTTSVQHMKIAPTTRAVTKVPRPEPVAVESTIMQAIRILAEESPPQTRAAIIALLGPKP